VRQAHVGAPPTPRAGHHDRQIARPTAPAQKAAVASQRVHDAAPVPTGRFDLSTRFDVTQSGEAFEGSNFSDA
jgi:hypothetical protein